MTTNENKRTLCAPIAGTLRPITEASDEVFRTKMMGDGYLIEPAEETIVAPEGAEVTFVFETKHAIGLKGADGTEYLIHLGIDTVALAGEGFTSHVEDGAKVQKGDKLLTFNDALVKTRAKSDACLVVFTALENEHIELTKTGNVKALEEIGHIVSDE